MARYAWAAWFALCAVGAVTLLWLMFRALDGSTAMFCIGCQGGLDSAQHALEEAPELERNRGYNWPVFKQANSFAKLSCQDSLDRTLRTCIIRSRTVDPATGELSAGLSVVDSFACSTTTCEWVDRR
jgi:hypothetical protein